MLRSIPLRMADNQTVHLMLADNRPVQLGEGKFARVFLGSTEAWSDSAGVEIGNLIAIKFLKRDESTAVTANALYRFCQEVLKTAECKRQGLKATVVSIVGYGRYRVLPDSGTRELRVMEEAFGCDWHTKDNPGKVGHVVFGSATLADLNQRFLTNSEAASILGETYTGDFYGLDLCLMSLDELLLTHGDPFSKSSGSALAQCGISAAPILLQRSTDTKAVRRLKLELRPNANGFDDLDALARWIDTRDKKSDDLLSGKSFRRAVLFDLARACLARLKELHRCDPNLSSRPTLGDTVVRDGGDARHSPGESPDKKEPQPSHTLSVTTDPRSSEPPPKDTNAAQVEHQKHPEKNAEAAAGNDRAIAHRDIKPGNILLSIAKPVDLLLSDLGFVASVSEIRAATFTMVSSIDEGGVLPVGTKGFRAPEQIESGEEITLEPKSSQKLKIDQKVEIPQSTLQVISYLETTIEEGDWLALGTGVRTDKAASNLARVIGIQQERDDDTGSCTVAALVPTGNLIKARIIKDVGLHSDIYALGCLAYYLGSEGRNAERFIRQFGDSVARQNLSMALPAWVLTSPLWFSAVLCIEDDTESLRRDVAAATRQYSELIRPVKQEHQETMIDALGHGLSRIVRRTLRRGGDEGKIADYRELLASDPASAPLLRGKRSGRPISFRQLYLTLLCCLRNLEDSIVNREDKLIDARGVTKGVFSTSAHTFAETIEQLISGIPESKPELGVLEVLGGSAAEVFIRARLAERGPKQI